MPKFDATGAATGGFTQSAADSATTTITAITVEKSEPSPEGELLRGVHDHTTVYTLQVTNNDARATNGVTAVDYLPAALEFLGCGGVDHTTTGPEYAGAPSLSATPAVTPCVSPASVTTVVNPSGLPAGTYTRVQWALGNLPAGATRTVRYAAGIPQRANTATWPGATPTGASLAQGANLDNNTGASTREGAGEASATNHAAVSGTYTGPVYLGGSPVVGDSDTTTVTVEDVRLRKSTDASTFTQGGEVRYTLTVDSSEYADGTDLVLVDHLPNGLCPLSATTNYVTGAPADCDPDPGFAPTNATITGVVQNADGSFDVTFSPLTIAANGTVSVEYSARMRTTYTGGAVAGDPTSAGDTFTNTVRLAGDTTPPAEVEAPAPSGTVGVGDDSSATITAGGPSLSKTILPDTTPIDCSAGGYLPNPPLPLVTFSEGSRVCFRIRVDFPTDVATRNVVLTDFLPDSLVYDTGSAVPTPANDVTIAVDASGPDPVVTLGDPGGSGTFVPKGSTFEVTLSGTVGTPAAGPAPDLTANLAKLRYSDGFGATVSLRDSVDFAVAAPPPVSILKGVAAVNGAPGGGNPPDTDGLSVTGGDVVTFRVDYTNDGTVANRNALDVLAPDLWDVLPAGITCADVSILSFGGVCTDPGDLTHPTFAGRNTLSAIRWDRTGAPPLAPGDTATLTYDVTIPTEVSVSTVFTNTAYVASYETGTNVGTTVEHLPADNVDTTTDSADWDVPAATDPSNVRVPDATVTKANTTDITETNNGLHQAVVGELVTYTVGVVVPARTTTYQGVLSDPLPTGLTFVSASAGFSATGTSPATDPLPAGFTLDAATGTVTFPSTYTNDDATGHLVEVTLRARVSTLSSNNNGVNRVNTARFDSDTAATGGSPLPGRTAQSTVTVVAPQGSLAKLDDDSDGVVFAGQTVTYTLRATGSSGRPPGHDAWVVDCVPAGLTFGAFLDPHPGTASTTPGTGTNGCAAGTTRVAWNVPTVVVGQQALSYSVVVDPAAAGGQTYTNTATLSWSSLDDGKADPLAPDNPLERIGSSSASDTVTVAGGTVLKSADPTSLTVGERGTWTIRVAVPPNVNFYNSAIIDQLPAAIDPASVVTEDVSCTIVTVGDCVLQIGDPLTPAPGPGGSTLVGWHVGDALANPSIRVAEITYSAVLRDLPSVDRGDVVTNTAHGAWDLVDGPEHTSAGDTFDRTTGNATADIRVLEPVLSVDKTVSDTTPAPGETFTYAIDVTNLVGPHTSPAHHVTVVDTVPAGVVVDPATISDGGVLTGAGPNGGGTVTWTDAGPVPVGSTISFAYDATLAPSASLGTAGLVNTADITRYESLPSGGRTYDGPSDPATVTPAFPHVSVDKAVVGGSVAYLGESKPWSVTATSNGATTAYDVDVVDTLPPSWTYDADSARVSVAGGAAVAVEPTLSVVGGRQVLTWTNLGDIAPTKTIVVTFTATPGPDAVTTPGVGASVAHTNSAAVSADDRTGASGNASGSYAGPPDTANAFVHSADVTLTKTHTGTATAGQNLVWTLTVHNDGPDTAVGPFRVVDTLPSGIGATSASGSGWTCSTSLTEVDCARTNAANTLASGASFAVITVTTAIPPDTPSGTTFTNGATVSDRTYDPDLSNNTDTDSSTAVRSVDLAIDKALSGPITAGQDATYTLVVTNHGPSDSSGPIVVTDTVPAGTSYVSAGGPGWSCDEAGGAVTCTRVTGLDLGQTAPAVTLVVTVDAGRTAPVVNTGHVTGPSPDPAPGNNTDTVTTTPGTSADLALEKSSTTDFVAGTDGTYRFTVENFGPSDAASPVRVTDTLPAALTFDGFTSVTGSWSCSASGQDLTCTLAGSLAAGDEAVVDVTVAIAPGTTGNLHNVATVGSPTTDPNPSNNTDDDDTASDVRADLQITKTHTGTVVAGQDVAFTLAVRNNGPSDADGPVVVTDVLPAGLAYVSGSGPGWSCTSGTPRVVVCTHAAGLLAGTAAGDLTVVAAVAPDAGPATLRNIASVDGPDTDPVPDNNTDTDDVAVTDQANVSVTKTTTGANPVRAGEEVEFTIAVHNDGPSDADDVSLADTLPAGLTLVSVDTAGWTCTPTSPLLCSLPTLGAGSDAPALVVTALVGPGVPDGTTLTNTAEVSTSTPGDDPDDNADTATVGVLTDADLALAKSHLGGSAVAGEQVTFVLTASNNGPSDAQATVRVVDTLPAEFTYLSSTGPWDCAASGQTVTCDLLAGGLLAGESAPDLQLVAQLAADTDPGDYTNRAVVSSPTNDTVPANNEATDQVPVVTEADLSVVKSHAGDARVGDPLTFTLQVANAGPSQAVDVVVTDEVPAGLAFVSATGDGWTCDEAAGTLTCTLDAPLAAATDAAPITVETTVLPAGFPLVSNTAVVDSGTTERDPSDNTSTDLVPVPAQVDLAVTKSHTGEAVVGQDLDFTVEVTNAGPTDDPGPVTVTDTLPTGLTYVAASGDGWDCAASGATVTCTRDAGLSVDASSAITLRVAVGPAAYPSVTNTVAVGSPAEDLDPSNNVAQDPADVTPTFDLGVRKDLVSLVGLTARWRITVSNAGPSDTVGDVVVVDELPDQLSYRSTSGAGWTCTPAGRRVTCVHPGVIASGDSSSFVLTTDVARGATGEIVNTVAVLGEEGLATDHDSAAGRLPDRNPPTAVESGLDGVVELGVADLPWLVLGTLVLLGGLGLHRRQRRRS